MMYLNKCHDEEFIFAVIVSNADTLEGQNALINTKYAN